MNDVSEGIVLSSRDYREKDTLISVLTKEFGRISLVAKGTMSVHSKNAPACLPFTSSEFCFDYKETKTVFPLKTARINNSRRHVREDLDLLNFAGLLCELTEKISDQGVVEDELYRNLECALNTLYEDKYLSVCLFLSFVFRLIGIEPVVDECVLCGSTQVSSISIREGGFVCQHCRPKVHAYACTLEDLIHFRLLNKASFEHFELLKEKGPFTLNDVTTMIDFLVHHAGIRLHSWNWIRSLMD
ncbi:MAG: DNA repair protein RecO [Erysipelotrichaceae bacterium]|nr:DNA repair protein RecO [Erysipelotrichaceae bacterium]